MRILTLIWNWLKNNNEILLGITTIIITLVYGYWGVSLSRKQVKLSEAQIELSKAQEQTSVDLLHFSELLHKTDNVITLSTEQLKLNREAQEKANTIYNNNLIGSMNRLRIANFKINDEHMSLVSSSLGVSENDIIEYRRRLNRLMELLVSEMDNTYLNSDSTMTKLWSLTYGNIATLDGQLEYDLAEKGRNYFNPTTGERWVGKVDSEHAALMIKNKSGDIFISVGALNSYVYIKSKEDRIKWGLLGKDGKPNVNPEDQYIQEPLKQRKEN